MENVPSQPATYKSEPPSPQSHTIMISLQFALAAITNTARKDDYEPYMKLTALCTLVFLHEVFYKKEMVVDKK